MVPPSPPGVAAPVLQKSTRPGDPGSREKVVFFQSDPIFRPDDVCFQASDRLPYGYSRMTEVGVLRRLIVT